MDVARPGAGRQRLSAYLGTQELSASGTTADTEELCSSPVQLRQKSNATAPLINGIAMRDFFILAYFFNSNLRFGFLYFCPLSP